MAAGLGFKTFTTGEVLTAGDVNGYLMQGILVFASTAARDAAITAPQEGQFAFTKDTNGLWYYDGAAWVASGATGDIEGVTAGVGISGGGTSGTVTITNSMATAIDAKGDLVPGTGADTFARLAVGANDTVLTADSTTATGLKWATPAGGGLDLLSTTTMTSSTLTISSISQDYDQLVIVINNAYFSSGSNGFYFQLRCNSDTGSNYNWGRTINTSGGSYNGGAAIGQTSIQIAQQGDSSTTNDRIGMYIIIPNYKDTTPRIIRTTSMSKVNDPTFYDLCATYTGSSAIDSLTFFTGTGTMTAGTIKVYGVK
jgi:hypothetical protein